MKFVDVHSCFRNSSHAPMFSFSFSLSSSSYCFLFFFRLFSLSLLLIVLSPVSVSSYFLHFLVLSSSPLPNPFLVVLVYLNLRFCPCLFLFLVLLCLLPDIHRDHLLCLCVDGGDGGGDEKIYVRLSIVFVFVVSVSVSLFRCRYSVPVRPVPSSSICSACLCPTAALAAIRLLPLSGYCKADATFFVRGIRSSLFGHRSGRWLSSHPNPAAPAALLGRRHTDDVRLPSCPAALRPFRLSGSCPATLGLSDRSNCCPATLAARTVVHPLRSLWLLSGHSGHSRPLSSHSGLCPYVFVSCFWRFFHFLHCLLHLCSIISIFVGPV